MFVYKFLAKPSRIKTSCSYDGHILMYFTAHIKTILLIAFSHL